MGHRSAERAFLDRSLNIHVDPLTVTGQFGEVVDHLLGHDDGGTPLPEGFGGESVDGVDVVEGHRSHSVLFSISSDHRSQRSDGRGTTCLMTS